MTLSLLLSNSDSTHQIVTPINDLISELGIRYHAKYSFNEEFKMERLDSFHKKHSSSHSSNGGLLFKMVISPQFLI